MKAAWDMLALALTALPAVAESLREALEEGKYDEATAARVRKILPVTSETKKALNKIRR